MLDKPDKDGRFFAVRDLPEKTRRKIKVYAAERGLTMSQALTEIVESALTWVIIDKAGDGLVLPEVDRHLLDLVRANPELILQLIVMHRYILAHDYAKAYAEADGLMFLLRNAAMIGGGVELHPPSGQQPALPDSPEHES